MKEIILSFLLAFGLISCSKKDGNHQVITGYAVWCSLGSNSLMLVGISATPVQTLNTYTNVFVFTDTMSGSSMEVSLPCYVKSVSSNNTKY